MSDYFLCRNCGKPRELDVKRYQSKDKNYTIYKYRCGSKVIVEHSQMSVTEFKETVCEKRT